LTTVFGSRELGGWWVFGSMTTYPSFSSGTLVAEARTDDSRTTSTDEKRLGLFSQMNLSQ